MQLFTQSISAAAPPQGAGGVWTAESGGREGETEAAREPFSRIEDRTDQSPNLSDEERLKRPSIGTGQLQLRRRRDRSRSV